MKKIGLLYNPSKENAEQRAVQVALELEKLGYKSWVSSTQKEINNWNLTETDTDLLVIFGGDGTFLAATRKVHYLNIPIMGINHGHLGFLTEYGDIEAIELANSIHQREYKIEDRVMIEVRIPQLGHCYTALNEIVVMRSHYSNLLYTDLYVDNDLLHSFRSDGIIICTPTGSTAYALSAGGAVMDPNIKAFQIVPIAAHSLSSRPHVISDDRTIVLESRDSMGFFMQPDGQELITLEPKSSVIIKKASNTLKLVKLKQENRSFYNILREKMKWGS